MCALPGEGLSSRGSAADAVQLWKTRQEWAVALQRAQDSVGKGRAWNIGCDPGISAVILIFLPSREI